MEDVTTLILLRHGPVSGPARLLGRTDGEADLTDLEPYRKIATQVPGDAVVLSSPLARCTQTLSAMGCNYVESIAGLQEQDFGA